MKKQQQIKECFVCCRTDSWEECFRCWILVDTLYPNLEVYIDVVVLAFPALEVVNVFVIVVAFVFVIAVVVEIPLWDI